MNEILFLLEFCQAHRGTRIQLTLLIKADSSLFILHKPTSITLILVYVDDIILTGSDSPFLSQLVSLLGSKFVMKDLGSLHYFLGLEVTYFQHGLCLTQSKYVSEILTKAGMEDCKPSASPTSTKGPYDPSDPPFDNVSLFRTLVGSLQYLTLTRPDIAFAVNTVCQHMHQPKLSHFLAVKRLIRYIKGTINHGLYFTDGPLSLTAYADADWAGDPVDRRSTSGFVVFLGATPVSWSAKKQPTVARSSTEAEYRAMAQTAADLVWIPQLLTELQVSIAPPHVLWCDNRSAMALASNPVFHACTKHIEIDYHFIREQVLAKKLVLHFIASHAQVANIFTKGLPVSRFVFLKSKLKVGSSPTMSLQGGVKRIEDKGG
ncbi:uncharacterized mitochondrial protein AtMg00810-like [Rhododendron vialii]|uniref:uncharacterized mitochondrial protein AtMg00810-like n=1 Tax=Rhododendron vialii TaxID=182163 RepID=UPI0026605A04|nr:uncharacterized mitochondrial protein AtMg00810-like [Rhododendron vialii]